MTVLTDEVLGGFKLAKVFHDCSHPVTSLEFSSDGEACLAASTEDESIHLYDSILGKSQKMVYSKKYGVGLVRFTHKSTNVLCSSTKGEPTIRHLSLHDNAYLRYFCGHASEVSALEMSPLNDVFLSGAVGDSVRLWDLRSPNCEGSMRCEGRPVLAVDPQGLVFAVGTGSRTVKLYDMKNYHSGPFAVFEIEEQGKSEPRWTQLRFSPDGRDLLLTTSTGLHLINSFDGILQCSLQLDAGIKPAGEGCFSPDGRYVLAGADDRSIYAWSRSDGKRLNTMFEGHAGRPKLVRFNPSRLMFASACTNLAFWIPEL